MAEIGFYYNLLYFSQICTIFLSELSMQQYGILIKSSGEAPQVKEHTRTGNFKKLI